MIKVILILLLPAFAFAGEFGTLKCDECGFREKIKMGPTMHDAELGLSHETFFCKQTKKFVKRTISIRNSKKAPAEVSSEEPFARETRTPVAPKAGFNLFTDPTCKNGLVPVRYYIGNPQIPCPICGRGHVEYENLGFRD